jgi:hypothetical protein
MVNPDSKFVMRNEVSDGLRETSHCYQTIKNIFSSQVYRYQAYAASGFQMHLKFFAATQQFTLLSENRFWTRMMPPNSRWGIKPDTADLSLSLPLLKYKRFFLTTESTEYTEKSPLFTKKYMTL